MDNRLFISRCETVITTMRASSSHIATTKQIAKWLNIDNAAASQFMIKICKYNILQKQGAAAKTTYTFSESCSNFLERRIHSTNDVVSAVSEVINWFINCQTKPSLQKITSATGKELVRVKAVEEVDNLTKQSINNLLTLINQNKKMEEQLQLLNAEIERLKPFEEKYRKLCSNIKNGSRFE